MKNFILIAIIFAITGVANEAKAACTAGGFEQLAQPADPVGDPPNRRVVGLIGNGTTITVWYRPWNTSVGCFGTATSDTITLVGGLTVSGSWGGSALCTRLERVGFSANERSLLINGNVELTFSGGPTAPKFPIPITFFEAGTGVYSVWTGGVTGNLLYFRGEDTVLGQTVEHTEFYDITNQCDPEGEVVNSAGDLEFELTDGDGETVSSVELFALRAVGSNDLPEWVSLGSDSSSPFEFSADSTVLRNGTHAIAMDVSYTNGGTRVKKVLENAYPVQNYLIAGGGHHSARVYDGDAETTGYNNYGQLGNGTTTDRDDFADVASISGTVTQVAAGPDNTCAITSTGALYCWGRNIYQQVGNGSSGSIIAFPHQIFSSGTRSVSVGFNFTCAVHNEELKCWGANDDKQLTALGGKGGGTPITRTISPPSGRTHTPQVVELGYKHACALYQEYYVSGGQRSTETLYCWGRGNEGQIGDGNFNDTGTPYKVATGVISFSLGAYHTCYIANDTRTYCVGKNGNGQVGNDSTTNTNTFTEVYYEIYEDAAAIVATTNYASCISTRGTDLSSGDMYCWGRDGDQEQGNGSGQGNVLEPEEITLPFYDNGENLSLEDCMFYSGSDNGAIQCPGNVHRMSGGAYHMLIMNDLDQYYAHGRGNVGQLDNGSGSSDRYEPSFCWTQPVNEYP